MPHFKKHFTVSEANDLIPQVISVLDRVHSIREQLQLKETELDSLHEAAPGNGGSGLGGELISHSETIGRILAELEEAGIVVKDIEIGLVDFPHLRDDHEVFLCWKLGEKRIGWWHEIEAGYRGRRPL